VRGILYQPPLIFTDLPEHRQSTTTPPATSLLGPLELPHAAGDSLGPQSPPACCPHKPRAELLGLSLLLGGPGLWLRGHRARPLGAATGWRKWSGAQRQRGAGHHPGDHIERIAEALRHQPCRPLRKETPELATYNTIVHRGTRSTCCLSSRTNGWTPLGATSTRNCLALMGHLCGGHTLGPSAELYDKPEPNPREYKPPGSRDRYPRR